jgi:branched-chain amino acid aminotransferase
MHPLLLFNDELRDTRDLLLSPGQVGTLNGWGVFTTIRVYDGVMFVWDRHYARLQRDAQLMHVPMPESAWLEQQLYRLIDANRCPEATLRIAILRNKGGMFQGPGVTRDWDLVAFTRDVNHWGEWAKLGVVHQARHAANEFAGTKILSWAQNLTWYERAHQQGFDEVVLLNERNEVSECTSANLFAVFGDRVLTPHIKGSGCLPGITRDVILNDLAVPGLTVAEHVLWLADLGQADEVFITSTTREVMPVSVIDGVRDRRRREVSDRIQAAFREFTNRYTAAHRRVGVGA